MAIVYQEPLVAVRCGHVIAELAALAPASYQLCLTSPPYYSLRSYAVEPQVWGGAPGCGHAWRAYRQPWDNRHGAAMAHGLEGTAKGGVVNPDRSTTYAVCQLCSAWLGHLGLEPRPWCRESLVGEDCTDQCYLGHLLQVCDGVWRVLRDDGLLVWNMGDSYASSPVGRFNGGSALLQGRDLSGHEASGHVDKVQASGLAPKNLLNLPARFSIAMQGRGWILRSAIPWTKMNCMPGSQQDRPTVSHEHIYMFVKSGRYYWDGEAIRENNAPSAIARRGLIKTLSPKDGLRRGGALDGSNRDVVGTAIAAYGEGGRTRRTGDWWDESLDLTIADMEAWVQHAKSVRDHGGLLLSPEGEPLGLNVNPQPTKMAHFAAFPPKLVKPFILAATSQVGCCARCGTPYRRVVAHTRRSISQALTPKTAQLINDGHRGRNPGLTYPGWRKANVPNSMTTTLGWEPGCTCQDAAVVPCTVLDPFAGTGVTLSVARSLGRQSVGIDLSAEYCELMKETLHADLALFPAANEDEDRALRVIQGQFDWSGEGE